MGARGREVYPGAFADRIPARSSRPATPRRAFPGVKQADDVVIVAALRTPLTRAKGGGLAGLSPPEILAPLLAAVADKAGVPKDKVEDIQVGNCRLPGAGTQEHRMAMLQAGFPYDTCLSALNRFCSSGLQAVANISAEIKSGIIEVGLAAGVEVMSYDSLVLALSLL